MIPKSQLPLPKGRGFLLQVKFNWIGVGFVIAAIVLNAYKL